MKFSRLTLVAGVSLVASAAQAHHSFGRFDNAKAITLEGTVTDWEWSNPHVWLYMKSQQGTAPPATWGIEGRSVSDLSRLGLKKMVFKPGDKVVVQIHPVREVGKTEGSLIGVVSINGVPFTGGEFGGRRPPGGAPPPSVARPPGGAPPPQ